MSFAIGSRHLDERAAIDRAEHSWRYVEALRQMGDGALLRLQHRLLLARVGDLQDDLCTITTLDDEILIALARQRARLPIDAEVAAGDLLGGGEVELRALVEEPVGACRRHVG